MSMKRHFLPLLVNLPPSVGLPGLVLLYYHERISSSAAAPCSAWFLQAPPSRLLCNKPSLFAQPSYGLESLSGQLSGDGPSANISRVQAGRVTYRAESERGGKRAGDR